MLQNLKKIMRRKARKGLTLIELAIVLLVLGIIMGIVFVNLKDATGVITSAKKLKVKQVQALQLPMAIERYLDEGGVLNPGDSLSVLAQKLPDSDWQPVSEDLFLDPWNTPYFICQGDDGSDRICSRGKDKQDGGEGENADFQLDDQNTWPDWLKKK